MKKIVIGFWLFFLAFQVSDQAPINKECLSCFEEGRTPAQSTTPYIRDNGISKRISCADNYYDFADSMSSNTLSSLMSHQANFIDCSSSNRSSIINGLREGLNCMLEMGERASDDAKFILGQLARTNIDFMCGRFAGNHSGSTQLCNNSRGQTQSITVITNINDRNLRSTVFHESIHLLGYRHENFPDYAYACGSCCVTDSDELIVPFYSSSNSRSLMERDRQKSCSLCSLRNTGRHYSASEYKTLLDGTIAAYRRSGGGALSQLVNMSRVLLYGLRRGYISKWKDVFDEYVDSNVISVNIFLAVAGNVYLKRVGSNSLNNSTISAIRSSMNQLKSRGGLVYVASLLGIEYLSAYNSTNTRNQELAHRNMMSYVRERVCNRDSRTVARFNTWRNYLDMRTSSSASSTYRTLSRMFGRNMRWLGAHFSEMFEDLDDEAWCVGVRAAITL